MIKFNIIGMFVILFGAFFSEIKFFDKKFSKIFILSFSIFFAVMSIVFVKKFYLFTALSDNLCDLCYIMLITYTEEIYPTIIKDHAVGFMLFIDGVAGFASQFVFISVFKYGKLVPLLLYIISLLIGMLIIIFLPKDNISNIDSLIFENFGEKKKDYKEEGDYKYYKGIEL